MALPWGRKANDPRPAAPALKVLRAAGQRIDLKDRNTITRLNLTKQQWQDEAWDFRDTIGELRYAHQLLAQSVARVRFFPAALRDHPEQPVPLTDDGHGLDPQLVADALTNFRRLPIDSDPDGFLARAVSNMATVGEFWIHGSRLNTLDERWDIRSVSEIITTGDRVQLRDLPGQNTGVGVVEGDVLLRCWREHPRFRQWADCPLRTMLDVAEEVILASKEMRATARSRAAANGVLLVPDDLAVQTGRHADDDTDAHGQNTFMQDFTIALVNPLRDEGDPSSAAPIVIQGPAEDLDRVRHLRFDRSASSEIADRQKNAITRLLHGLDIQPEQVEGYGASNHWGGWLSEAASIRHQVEPMAGIVAGCLTQAYLHAVLISLDHDPEQVRRIIIATDPSDLAKPPNRREDAREAHDRLLISDEVMRNAVGYDESDAPDDVELQRRVAMKAGIAQDVAAGVLEMRGFLRDIQARTGNPAVTESEPPRQIEQGELLPENPTPAEPTEIVAAAVPAWHVDIDACLRVGDVESGVVTDLLDLANSEVEEKIRVAGGRLRNATRSVDKSLAASLNGVDALDVPELVGEDVILAAGVTDLLARSREKSKARFDRVWARAVSAVEDTVSDIAGRSGGVRARLEPVGKAVWSGLAGLIEDSAERVLFGDPADDRGETPDGPVGGGDVIAVMARAGGFTATVSDHLASAGGVVLGRVWQYRAGILRDTFGPHRALDGTRFDTYADHVLRSETPWIPGSYRPGDHRGCRCTVSDIVAIPPPGVVLTPEVVEGAKARYLGLTAAGVRRVRTPAGAEQYGQPIGSIIVPDVDVPKVRALRPITEADRARLKKAGYTIPPAWTDVQVADNPDADLQVKGKDAKGRVQSMYSREHTARQAAAKFERIQLLADKIEVFDRDIDAGKDSNDTDAALWLIRHMGLRPGSDSNTGAEKQAYGATNMLVEHVKVDGDTVRLEFTGKKGVDLSLPVDDPEIAAFLKAKVSGRSDGRLWDTNERKVGDRMKALLPGFKTKDLRTLKGTLTARAVVAGMPVPENAAAWRRQRREVGVQVSQVLGNTPTVALESYISPDVFAPWGPDPTVSAGEVR